MSYFSRLTDIVTCNLSEILEKEADPKAAIEQILYEIREGVAGAERSLKTARHNAESLEREIREHSAQANKWAEEAKEAVRRGDENAARRSLMRKSELSDLAAGLEQQIESAHNLVAHLTTMHRALEARLADAQRKQRELLGAAAEVSPNDTVELGRVREIEDELAALKKELEQN